jgi:hypothetical protein
METDKKCLRCGSTRLQPGKLQSGGGVGGVCFEPDIVKRFAFNHSVEVRADICLDAAPSSWSATLRKRSRLPEAPNPCEFTRAQLTRLRLSLSFRTPKPRPISHE